MQSFLGVRTALALVVAAIAAGAGLLLSGDVQASLVVLVCAVAAVLVAASGGDAAPAPPLPVAAPAPGEPAIADVIEAIAEPVLVIADNRVEAANHGARELLGRHVLGEDVRVAIRHPAAAERLMRSDDGAPGAPIHLVGLGTRDQRWEMRVRTLGDGRRVVHLIDRTGSYAAERMRVDFVANASHELRTPLASLLGYVETLREDAGDDPGTRARFLKIVFGEAQRMQRLIEDLISLSRIEAEKYRVPDKAVDLADLIDQVTVELSGSPRAADLVIQIADVPAVVGDPTQLSQLLHNVIGNAMKYGRDATPVTVTLQPEGEAMVRLSVADEGEGIPPQHIPRLTERFYRVDSGRSRSLGGTGLGLAIVKHIVERHRGRLDIASAVGKGTTVTILLPVQRLS
ncbi:two-component system phosphate regulon sensor histidine kinase PhoR [Sphingomonas naasensis]|uniref:histidine kinase n=1 Tax=Sphingomonas naasensis TaxID=1344951 RepID=A0A4S1WVT5_9SPHN|nr:ATP-binding protein [Sphingomonas naasensis]NIJ19358.1 two-component system phosphate regulon sensor histidine kinase PhoR [Sphingomonas naasensis]TGX46527.1 ATPase [Sphingomonas naasensis]